jgi:cytochrome c oxidase subunit 4
MEKERTHNDVSRLVQGSMRPYDENLIGDPATTTARVRPLSPRAQKLRSLMSGEVLLNVLSALLALGFLALAASNFTLAGSFLSIDSLFLTAVSLMLAAVFLVTPLLTLKEKGMLKNPFAGGADVPVLDEGPIHFEGSTKLFGMVLIALLVLTLVEVLLAYFEVPLTLMLTILMGLSIIKAALIIAYFMHLRFERLSLVLTLVPILVVCICLLLVFFPDSFRSLNLRSTQAQTTAAPATGEPEAAH